MTGSDAMERRRQPAARDARGGKHELEKAPVGVVIPAYNRRRQIIRALVSIAAQTVAPHLVVVVDDGSTDATADVAADWFALGHPFETRLLRQPNSGAGAARNAGWSHISHLEFMTFLDSDDEWPPDFIEACLAALSESPAAVAAVADRLMVHEGQNRTISDDMRQLCAEPIPWLFRFGAGVLSCSVLRASAANQVGPFDPGLPTGQDAALLLPLSLKGPWVRARCAPVRFYRDYRKVRKGEGNLSMKFGDNHARWAAIYTRFYRTGLKQVPGGQSARLCRELAMRWRRAGREHRKQGRAGKAAVCYARSAGWRLRGGIAPFEKD